MNDLCENTRSRPSLHKGSKALFGEARSHGMTAISSHNLKYVVKILVGSLLHSFINFVSPYVDDNEAVQGMFPAPETQLPAIGYASVITQ
jgi:hypothetical protein